MGLTPGSESEDEAQPGHEHPAREGGSGVPARLPLWDPPTDVLVTEEAVVVRLDLAGTTPDDIRVRAAPSKVIVSGVRRDPLGPARRRIDRMEIAFGPFERTIPLPCPVDPDCARAHLVGGLLEINLPLSDPPAAGSLFFDIRITMSV